MSRHALREPYSRQERRIKTTGGKEAEPVRDGQRRSAQPTID